MVPGLIRSDMRGLNCKSYDSESSLIIGIFDFIRLS